MIRRESESRLSPGSGHTPPRRRGSELTGQLPSHLAVCLSEAVMGEFKRILDESDIVKCAARPFLSRLIDSGRPRGCPADRIGTRRQARRRKVAEEERRRQAGTRSQARAVSHLLPGKPRPLLVQAQKLSRSSETGSVYFASQTAKIGSMVDVNNSDDPEGMQIFYYLVQDLKVSGSLFPPL